jgi:hypothetical protein
MGDKKQKKIEFCCPEYDKIPRPAALKYFSRTSGDMPNEVIA